MKKKNANRQRDIINYVMHSTEEVFTIESVSEQFDCTIAEASRTLSNIAKNGLGLVRSIRGTYKKSNNVKKSVVAEPKQTTFSFEDNVSNNGKATWPRPSYNSSMDYIQICQAIINLSEQCGGMDILIERATDLKKQGYGK